MAKLEDAQEAIGRACEVAAVEVTGAVGSALATPSDAHSANGSASFDTDSSDASVMLNAAAARAWRNYELAVTAELTGEQEERIAALLATTRH